MHTPYQIGVLHFSLERAVFGCITRAVFFISEVLPFQFLVVKIAMSESAYLVCPLYRILAASKLDRIAENLLRGACKS